MSNRGHLQRPKKSTTKYQLSQRTSRHLCFYDSCPRQPNLGPGGLLGNEGEVLLCEEPNN